MSKPASNPKSDTAKSAALEVFGLGFHYGAKAALFTLITRLFESPSGTITVNGVGLREDSLQALARMGVVFQAPAATAAG